VSRRFQIGEKRVSVYKVEPAKGVDGWRRKWHYYRVIKFLKSFHTCVISATLTRKRLSQH